MICFSRFRVIAEECPESTTKKDLIAYLQWPSWTELVDHLLAFYPCTLPGVYLDLALPSIPPPPSSAENSDCDSGGKAS